MKKYLIIITFLLSCNRAFTQTMEKNIIADNALLKVFETGDITVLDGIISPKIIIHAADGDKQGIEALKMMVNGFHANFKPTKLELLRRLSDNEYVSDWVRMIGQTPNAVIEGIEMTRYEDGKAVEHWFFPNSQQNAK